MKQKATITIEGESSSNEVRVSCAFDPPVKDGDGPNAAASTACEMIASLKGAVKDVTQE